MAGLNLPYNDNRRDKMEAWMRNDGRRLDEMRKVKIKRNVLKFAEGSCMIEMGNTKVICSASVENKVPPFLRDTGSGWITAEYGMLPRS